MDERNRTVIKSLTEHANEIVAGSYKNVDKLFSLTDKTDTSHDLTELAEAFGMMLLQVETREYALKQNIEELKKKNTHIESLSDIRSQLSEVFVTIVLVVTSFIFVLGILTDDSISKLPFFIVLTDYPVIDVLLLLIIIRLITVGKLKIKDFGLTLTGWKRSVAESLIISVIFIALLALTKHFLIVYFQVTFKGTKIFDFSYFGLSFIAYLLISPLQEFVARGTVQGSLERLLDTRNKAFISILVATLLFGALHMQHSLNLAVASFITGWLWGWMYHRQKNLIGVSLSHFLIGSAADLMGAWDFF